MKDVVGIVLAAGFGSRLRPATLLCPKPLLPVAGVEPLFLALHRLSQAGVRRVVVNAHHLARQLGTRIQDWNPRFFPELEIRLSHETPEILGSGGGLLKIIRDQADWTRGSRLVVLNGDTLTHLDPREVLRQAPVAGRIATFSFSRLPEHLERYGPVWIAEDQKTFRYRGVGSQARPPNSLPAHFLGLHMLESETVERLRDDRRFGVRDIDLFSGIYVPLIEEGGFVDGLEFFDRSVDEGFWFDLNTSEFLLEAQRWLLESLRRPKAYWRQCLQRRHPGIKEAQPGIWISGSQMSTLAAQAPSVIALDSHAQISGRVGPYVSVVGRSLLLPQLWQLENASLVLDEASAESSRKIANEVVVVPFAAETTG